MIQGNAHFSDLKREYVFPIIDDKLETLKKSHPDSKILNLGVGDVALPLCAAPSEALIEATLEMSQKGKVFGYGPSQGYLFLRKAIQENRYPFFTPEEIFISDGINTDITGILELFDPSCKIALPSPAYPAYLDSNIMAGRKKQIVWMHCSEETRQLPAPPQEKVDLIYLCSPHNPTGQAMSYEELKAFVDYALETGAILLYDGAYEAFIRSPTTPKSLYDIPGADKVGIEFCSFSKSAGFTGLRCSFTVIPKGVKALFAGSVESLNKMWLKRQSVKFNGVAYPIQKAAEACMTPKGQRQIEAQVQYYLDQTQRIKEALEERGQTFYGGIDCPYLWWKVPGEFNSWSFFDHLLEACNLLCVPGIGFGPEGNKYVRLSGFTTEATALEAAERLKQLLPQGAYALSTP